MNTIIKLGFVAGLLASAVAHAGPVNINKADAATLERELNGVGSAKAEAIVQDREAHGSFKTAEEITRVKGIGQATYEKNRDDIRVKD